MQGKTVAQSEVVLMLTPMPDETNFAGTIHGGHLLKHIDNAGALAARRHSRTNVVTASLERMDFLTPVRPGEVLILKASLHLVGRTSMEVGVRVEVENVTADTIRHAASCYLSFVALNNAGKPTPVPPLIISNDIEQERYEKALERKQRRIAAQAPGKDAPSRL
jgi:acyl-CoA hydrolase